MRKVIFRSNLERNALLAHQWSFGATISQAILDQILVIKIFLNVKM